MQTNMLWFFYRACKWSKSEFIFFSMATWQATKKLLVNEWDRNDDNNLVETRFAFCRNDSQGPSCLLFICLAVRQLGSRSAKNWCDHARFHAFTSTWWHMVVKRLENNHVSIFACINESFGSCVLKFLGGQGCVPSCAVHSPTCSTKRAVLSKTICCADAEWRAFLPLLFYFIVKCICMWVSGPARYASVNARHEKKKEKKEESWPHHFDGLNCLKTALLSKISHQSKLSNLCLFRY